jgi:hypothetical protein
MVWNKNNAVPANTFPIPPAPPSTSQGDYIPLVHIPRIPATQSMGRLPLSPREACHLIEATGMAIVEIFEAGGLAPFGLAQAGGEAAMLPLGALAVHAEPQALFAAESGTLWHLPLLHEGLGHPR